MKVIIIVILHMYTAFILFIGTNIRFSFYRNDAFD